MINAYNPQFSALDCSRMTEGDLRSQWRRPLRQSPYCETRANLRSGRPLGNAADNAKVRQYLHPFDHTCFNDLGRNYLDGAYPQANSQASTSQPPAFTAAPNTTATPQVSLPRSDSHTQPGVFSHDPSLSLHQKQPIAGPATGQYVIQAGAAGQENVWGSLDQTYQPEYSNFGNSRYGFGGGPYAVPSYESGEPQQNAGHYWWDYGERRCKCFHIIRMT